MTSSEQVEGGLDDPAALEPEPGTLALSSEEDTHTRADWESAAAALLRKSRRMADEDPDSLVWERLTQHTLDGVPVPPLGTADLLEDLATQGRPARAGAWDIRAHVGAGPEQWGNEEALADLDGGATSLWVDAGPDTDLATLLDGVLLDLAPVVLQPSGDPATTARAFLDFAGDRELHPGTNLGLPAADADAEQASLARDAGLRGFVVDGTRVHDRGASDAQELGWALASAATYLRRLTRAGLSVEEAAGLLEFRLAVTDEQLPSIAKLRAARRLWARMLELSGVSTPAPPSPGSTTGTEVSMRLHAVTSRPMMTRYDPYVNVLRTTVAAFAAGVGGADAVTVLPFDSALGRPQELGRRIARNTSHLLVSESHVARVTDPTGGAYAVEKLTDDLARAAWQVLGTIEEQGSDAFEAAVAAVVEQREQQVATRQRPVTGVSEFPDLTEELPRREPDGSWHDVRPWAGSFEAMRDDPPASRVFLATLGSLAAHTARATFATNLLAAGGVAVDVAGPTEGVDDLLAAYGGQPVVCLAGTDTAYAEWGEQAAAALREAGAGHVMIAGQPADYTDDSCATGVDAVAFLTRTREELR